jgi:hypothetical protein
MGLNDFPGLWLDGGSPVLTVFYHPGSPGSRWLVDWNSE